MKYLKVKDYTQFKRFDYVNANINTFAQLGHVLFKDNEIGVVIQLHEDHDVRTDMWGNCSPGECSLATMKQVQEFRPALIKHLA